MRREMEQLIRRQGKAETDSERQQISQELADLLEKWRKAALHLKPRTLYETPVRMDSRFESYGRAILEGLEAYGTENFPKKEGKSIYGKAIVNIVILPTGRLEAAEIVKSSGIKELDQHALQAIRRLTPLPPFNKELRRDVDRVVFTLPFEYTKTDPKP